MQPFENNMGVVDSRAFIIRLERHFMKMSRLGAPRARGGAWRAWRGAAWDALPSCLPHFLACTITFLRGEKENV